MTDPVPTYTSVERVEELLGLAAGTFSETSTPTKRMVIELIQAVETEINRLTRHSWKSETVTNEIYDLDARYQEGTGIPVYLRHRSIKTFATGSGDKLEVWDGSAWVDWLNISNGKTESRANDFWVDYEQGIIYFKTFSYSSRMRSVRVTYRYGESTVPKDVEMAATYMVAADVLRADRFANIVPETGDSATPQNQAEKYDRLAENLLESRKEFQTING